MKSELIPLSINKNINYYEFESRKHIYNNTHFILQLKIHGHIVNNIH